MKNYFKRLLFVAIYFLVFLFIFLSAMYFFKYAKTETTYMEYLNSFLQLKVIGLYAAMVLFYPLMAFMTLKRHIDKDYSYNQEVINTVMEEMGYVKTFENEQFVDFNKKNGMTRFMLFFMDKIRIDKSDNPLKINGLRKEIQKINRRLDDALL